MTSHKLQAQLCPLCHYTLDAATNAEPEQDAGPKPGDVTVCLGCASPLQFGEDLQLQPLDLDTVPADIREKLEYVIEAIKLVKRDCGQAVDANSAA